MDPHSLTYQQLPDNLLRPVMEGVLTLAEAAWLWDLFLLHPGQWIAPPPELGPALKRLDLWQTECPPTLH